MIKITALLFTLLFFGCSDPGPNSLNLSLGRAELTINNFAHGAEATMGTRSMGDTEYEQITILVADTLYIELLNEKFQEGIVNWDRETFSSNGTMVFMTNRRLGSGFGPRSGFLIISDRTDSTISGIFNFELMNFASCCFNCPEDRASVEGKFFAGIIE